MRELAMKARVLFSLAFLIITVSLTNAQDRALLAGASEWQVVKSEEAPPGTKIRFAADGKLTVTFLIDGKPREVNGTYLLSGNQLTLKLDHNGKERIETRTIKKLTNSHLITEDRNRKLEELQR